MLRKRPYNSRNILKFDKFEHSLDDEYEYDAYYDR